MTIDRSPSRLDRFDRLEPSETHDRAETSVSIPFLRFNSASPRLAIYTRLHIHTPHPHHACPCSCPSAHSRHACPAASHSQALASLYSDAWLWILLVLKRLAADQHHGGQQHWGRVDLEVGLRRGQRLAVCRWCVVSQSSGPFGQARHVQIAHVRCRQRSKCSSMAMRE